MSETYSRRTFLAAGGGLVAAIALLWDANVNGGRPAADDDDDEDP